MGCFNKRKEISHLQTKTKEKKRKKVRKKSYYKLLSSPSPSPLFLLSPLNWSLKEEKGEEELFGEEEELERIGVGGRGGKKEEEMAKEEKEKESRKEV